jgi:xanthine dehydrogenase FAD-binding subunit
MQRVQDFAFHRPLSIDVALAALAVQDARPLAGGTDLVPQLREGRRSAAHVIDVKRIAGLADLVVLADGSVSIGSAASATAISLHPHVAKHFPAVASACRLIGSWQIQNRATLGGNVCNAAPSADGIPPLICHDAIAQIASSRGEREILVECLFAGPGRTILEPGEILTGLRLPAPPPRSAAAYLRFTPRREMDIAIAGVGAWVQLDASRKIVAARIALASVAPTPMRALSAERILTGHAPASALLITAGTAAAGDARPISDTRGSADYRRHLVAVLTRRALTACLNQLNVSIEAP